MAGFTFARLPSRIAHAELCEIDRFHRSYYPFLRKRYLRPELRRIDRLENDRRYPYVDDNGGPLELEEDDDSEASPRDPSVREDEDEDEDNESIDTLDALDQTMYEQIYGEDLY